LHLTGGNPATGEKMQIKARKVVKFRIAKAAKDVIRAVKKQFCPLMHKAL
jgi:DNA-binding protein HU-beta